MIGCTTRARTPCTNFSKTFGIFFFHLIPIHIFCSMEELRADIFRKFVRPCCESVLNLTLLPCIPSVSLICHLKALIHDRCRVFYGVLRLLVSFWVLEPFPVPHTYEHIGLNRTAARAQTRVSFACFICGPETFSLGRDRYREADRHNVLSLTVDPYGMPLHSKGLCLTNSLHNSLNSRRFVVSLADSGNMLYRLKPL